MNGYSLFVSICELFLKKRLYFRINADKISKDIEIAEKEAMKNKDTLKKDTITMLRAAILQVEKDSQKTLNDDEICAIVAKEVKKIPKDK